MASIRMHRKSTSPNRYVSKLIYSRTALETVLVSIAVLCILGVICSLTTKSLHRIILWFAPINSVYQENLVVGLVLMNSQLGRLSAYVLCCLLLPLIYSQRLGSSVILLMAQDGAQKSFLFSWAFYLLHGQ